jgi:cytidine deaminase
MTISESSGATGESSVDRAPVDWDALRAAAADVRSSAYAPYSGYLVGAAALADDGRLLTGCNVENAAYGVGLCAECGVVSNLHASGGGRLVAVACAGAPAGHQARVVLPCGRCRQLIAEQGGPATLVDTPDGPVPLARLLPDAFDASELVH